MRGGLSETQGQHYSAEVKIMPVVSSDMNDRMTAPLSASPMSANRHNTLKSSEKMPSATGAARGSLVGIRGSEIKLCGCVGAAAFRMLGFLVRLAPENTHE
jgi:hypothetical protein